MVRMKRRAFIAGMLREAAATAVSQDQFTASLKDATLPGAMAMDPRRPQYHFLPASNWMNDPNGPIYYRGNYHLFYQYNPNGAFWGDMHWGHAMSPDMVRRKHLPVALAPTPGGPDADTLCLLCCRRLPAVTGCDALLSGDKGAGTRTTAAPAGKGVDRDN